MATPDITPMKQCTKCGNEYPATTEFFSKRETRLRAQCKNCRREYLREYHREYYQVNADKIREHQHANADKIREYNREYYQVNADKIREQGREYRQANPDKRRAYYQANADKARAYYQANVDKKREQGRAWQRANPEKRRASQHRRRAQKKAVGGKFTKSDIERQKLMQTDKKGRLRCWWCSTAITEYHIDHRVPLLKGGANAPENLCLACPKCNLSKQARLPSEWNGRLL